MRFGRWPESSPTKCCWCATARLEPVDGIVPEYSAAADRYFEPEQARAWLAQLRTRISSMVRVTITPEWVGLLDFKTRFPSAISP
jgi:hypothetical protein